MLWGSNAREAHPIFFHHVLKAVHNGAKLIVVDPRRTPSAQWADLWLGLDVGTDIPLANAVAREIIEAGLANMEFVERATTGFEEYRESVEPWTLEEAERVTGVPADAIRELAHAYGRADRRAALLDARHHRAPQRRRQRLRADQPLAADRQRRHATAPASSRCAARTTCRAAATWARSRTGCPASRTSRTTTSRAKFEAAWGATIPPRHGLHLTEMFEAMEHGELTRLYVIGENPAQSEADQQQAERLLEGLDHLVVQDIFLTKTAQLADVVLPAAATLVRGRGHRHLERAARAARAQGARRRRARHATTSRSSTSSVGASVTSSARPRPRTSGTSCGRSRRCTQG